MIFLSDDLARVELRLVVEESPTRGELIRNASGQLEVATRRAGPVALARMEKWLGRAGLEVVRWQRQGRRWTVRARLSDEC